MFVACLPAGRHQRVAYMLCAAAAVMPLLLLQVWLVLELCTGGTMKDAVSMGKLKAQGRLEMVRTQPVMLTIPLSEC
jgi:hypothetical protein